MKSKHPKVIHKKLGKERAYGYYDKDKNLIVIDERLRGKKKFEIYIHEFLHHIFPFFDETQIDESAKKITSFMWAHNFRQVEP